MPAPATPLAADAEPAFTYRHKLCARGVGDPLDLTRGHWVVGMNQVIVIHTIAHRLGQPDRRPWAFQPARIDLDRQDLSLSNGFLGDRIDNRTGTAPNPNSRRNPLIR